MEKFSLKNLSICIPIRYDSEDRITNLKTVIAYFEKHFVDLEFLILEEEPDSTQHVPENIRSKTSVKYSFTPDQEFLHRTRMLNDLVKSSTRKFITTYDVDILIEPEAWVHSIKLLEKTDAFVFPYNGVFVDVRGEDRNKIIENLELPKVDLQPSIQLYSKLGNELHIIHNQSLGGAQVFHKETYLKCGGFNQELKSWGHDDIEISNRFNTIGYKTYRMPFPLFHLSHQRGIDSTPQQKRINDNLAILNKVISMNREQTLNYIEEKLK